MATQIDLGAVVPIGKGDWNSSTTYERANIVRHNSTAWICKVATSKGVEPSESSSDWYLLVKDISSVTSVNGMIGDVNINSISENPNIDDNSLKIASTSWVKTKVDNTTNELNTQISQVSSKADTALQTANSANTKANNALSKSEEASSKADIVKVFNSKITITTSNSAWTPPVTGWARVTVIGGGGGGGAGGLGYDFRAGKGGKVGGTTTFGTITVNPGCGGGGGGAGDNQFSGAGGGGGGAGQVRVEYVYFSGVTVNVIIGAGGAGGTGANGENLFGTDGSGTYGGKGGKRYVGGAGGKNSPSIGSGTRGAGGAYGSLNGCGGSGGMTGFGYGGGGGGGGGYSTDLPEYGKDSYGAGMDGGEDGKTGNGAAPASGGAGGSGAVIIEYYDPAKEVA